MGMLDREIRQVRATVVPNVKRATLQEKILNNVEGGSQLMTVRCVAPTSPGNLFTLIGT
jgi:hypothetical protein